MNDDDSILEDMSEEERISLEALRAIVILTEMQTEINKFENGTWHTFKIFIYKNEDGSYKFSMPSLTKGIEVDNGDLERMKNLRSFDFINAGKE